MNLRKLLSVVMCVALMVGVFNIVELSFAFTPIKAEAVMDEQFRYEDDNAALSNIKLSGDMEVLTVGDVQMPDELKNKLSHSKTTIDNIISGDAKTSKYKVKSLMISAGIEELLDEVNFKKLDKFMEKGYSVVFIDNKKVSKNKLLKLTAGANGYSQEAEDISFEKLNISEEDNKSLKQYRENTELGYMWVSKNKSGTYFMGSTYVNKGLDKKQLIKKAIVTAWHRQKDNTFDSVFSKKSVNDDLRTNFIKQVEANYTYDTMKIGGDWLQQQWVQENYDVGGVVPRIVAPGQPAPTPQIFGKMTVWATWATMRLNGQAFVARVNRVLLSPLSGFQTYGYYSGGDVDYYLNSYGGSFANKLFDHYPDAQPGTTSWSYGLGVSADSSRTISGSVDISFSGDDCDLWVYDGYTDYSQQKQQTWVGYKDYYSGPVKRSYVIQPTKQQSVYIFVADCNSNKDTLTTTMLLPYFNKLGDRSVYGSGGYYKGYSVNVP
ncbi:MAG: hypothetical protein ACOYWZ_10425 [Bacillota bacterium]